MARECDHHLIQHVLGAAIDVHRALGPGLLESVYERALEFELGARGIAVLSQVPIPAFYRGVELGIGFRADLLVDQCLVIEIKCVSHLDNSHVKQLLTYLRLADIETGLLLNFDKQQLRDRIRRVSLFSRTQ